MNCPDPVRTTISQWQPTELPPGLHTFEVDLNEQSDDLALTWHAFVVRGEADGPVLLVTAGVHGDEYEGMVGIRAFVNDLQPSMLRGTVIAIPVVHAAAYEAAQRCSPLDDCDLARTFPGCPDGTPSQRVAYALSRYVLSLADFFCDLHAAGMHYEIVKLTGYMVGPPDSAVKQYGACVAYGLPLIWATPTAPGRSLTAARDLDVPAIYVEYGGGGACPQADTQQCRRALRRLAAYLDMVDGDYPTQFSGTFVQDTTDGAGHLQLQGVAEASGFLEPRVALWQSVQRGQVLAEICDPLGRVVDTCRADRSGRIVLLRRTRYVRAGECCCSVMGKVEGRKMTNDGMTNDERMSKSE